jgi:hypothetical protein
MGQTDVDDRRFSLNRLTVGVATLAIALTIATPASAQLNGENLLGDTGVRNASQPAPGLYAAFLYYRYKTDTIRDADGNKVVLDPTQAGSQSLTVLAPFVVYVSKKKLLGANYGMMAVVPLGNGALEAPGFELDESVSTGLADIYIVPFQLGWHLRRADVTTAFAFFAPTGRHEPRSADNVGKGMWSYELSAGTTVYLDQKKSLTAATTAFWETHSKKEGTGDIQIGRFTLTGVKVGQLLTLEGGVAKSFLDGAAHVGMAYYAQWKITSDSFGLFNQPGAPSLDKHRVFGFGPDVTIPLATKSSLISLVNVRYFWETGAQLKTEGQSLVVTATFPVPSIKIPPK